MNKTLFLVLVALFVMTSVASDAFTDVKKILKDDQCVMQSMESVRPELLSKIEALKEKKDVQSQIELLSIVKKVKAISDKCSLDNKLQPVLGDAIEAAGISFLLASNCFKDVGAVLLIVDEVVQDPKNIENDIIIAIFSGILGMQGLKDCKQFVNFIVG